MTVSQVAASIRAWGALVAAVAGLAGSATALVRSANHSATRASHDDLAKQIETLSEQVAANHDDVERLRGFVEARERQNVPFAQPGASVPTPPAIHAAPPPVRAQSFDEDLKSAK